ncbi:MAG TPA: hypothetical protein VI643_01275 [Planctomycetota bacterium]|nr:hypothetical protein [Planctomycetota bacterium]
MRKTLLAALGVFLVIELALLVWALDVHGLEAALREFVDPVSLLVLADFFFFGAAVFLLWMVPDARARGRNPWPWAPLMVVSPTAALFVYLMVRGGPPSLVSARER